MTIKCIVCSNIVTETNYTPGSDVCHNCQDLTLEKKENNKKIKKYKGNKRKNAKSNNHKRN